MSGELLVPLKNGLNGSKTHSDPVGNIEMKIMLAVEIMRAVVSPHEVPLEY